MIIYASQCNNKANYVSYKEVLVVSVVAHFKPYLYGQKFVLITNHQLLKWLLESNKLTCKLA